jgi:hypothetical protein
MATLTTAAVEAETDETDPTQGSVPFYRRILHSLYFLDMNERASRIPPAFPNTFQWLFREDGPVEKRQPEDGTVEGGQELTFPQWLRAQGDAIFWITGVPASGKSTLMKYIASHASLGDRLQEWAGEDRVHMAKFYFWNPGSKTQKSRVGLLRSLLHQLLAQRPELAEAVAPRRHLFFRLAGDHAEPPEWEWEELQACVYRLAARLCDTGSRLALFIDGLDEYEGFVESDAKTHKLTDELVDFFMHLREKCRVKLCVSSRPYYFQDKFHGHPSLAMQRLTAPDIDLYVETRLGDSQAIKELRALEPDGVADLAADLKAKAQGVFLWVVLVVEQLLIASVDRPQLSGIQEALNEMPDDLNQLYAMIQKRIGPAKARVASKLYQLVMEWKRVWNGQMESTFLWLAHDQDLSQRPGYFAAEKQKHIATLIKRTIEAHTRGILQIAEFGAHAEDYTVDFLHKTAYEWLREPEQWDKILSDGPPEYQPLLPILAVLVSHVQSLAPAGRHHPLQDKCVHRIFMLAGEVPNTPANRKALVSIMDKLDVRGLRNVEINFDMPGRRLADTNPLTLAAVWGCHPYLRGKLEANPSLYVKPKERFSVIRKAPTPVIISLLEAAVLGFSRKSASTRANTPAWVREARGLDNAWRVVQRLETVKVLLERGGRIEGHVKSNLRDWVKNVGNSTEARYCNLVLEMAGNRTALQAFDDIRRKTIPDNEVLDDHAACLFPSHAIF